MNKERIQKAKNMEAIERQEISTPKKISRSWSQATFDIINGHVILYEPAKMVVGGWPLR